MTDAFIQLPPDSTGKSLDTEEITRLDGTVVERQRVSSPDALTALNDIAQLLTLLLAEQRVIRQALIHALELDGLEEDLDDAEEDR